MSDPPNGERTQLTRFQIWFAEKGVWLFQALGCSLALGSYGWLLINRPDDSTIPFVVAVAGLLVAIFSAVLWCICCAKLKEQRNSTGRQCELGAGSCQVPRTGEGVMRYAIAGMFFVLPVWAVVYTSWTQGLDGLSLLFSVFGFPLNVGLILLALAGVGVILLGDE